MKQEYHGVPFTPQQLERIEILKGRPNRDTVIGGDDILNLRIALETSTTVEDFLTKV
jgi:hypothetical protein